VEKPTKSQTNQNNIILNEKTKKKRIPLILKKNKCLMAPHLAYHLLLYRVGSAASGVAALSPPLKFIFNLFNTYFLLLK